MSARVIAFPARRSAGTLDDTQYAWLREQTRRAVRAQGVPEAPQLELDRAAVKAELTKILQGVDRRRKESKEPKEPTHADILQLLRRIDRRLEKIENGGVK